MTATAMMMEEAATRTNNRDHEFNHVEEGIGIGGGGYNDAVVDNEQIDASGPIVMGNTATPIASSHSRLPCSPSPRLLPQSSVFRSSVCDMFGRRKRRRRRRRRSGEISRRSSSRTSAVTSSSSSSSPFERSRRTDACAVAVCGGLCLLQQRNNFLLTRQKPKPMLSIKDRPIELGILMLILIIIFVSATVNDPYQYNMMLCMVGIVFVASTYKLFEFLHTSRVFRQQLAIYEWEMQQLQQPEQQGQQDDNRDGQGVDPELQSYLSSHYDEVYGNGAHVLCGCARDLDEDHGDDDDDNDDDDDEEENNDLRLFIDDDDDNSGDFCTAIWTCIANTCCGTLCQCYCQVCGSCATSQEHRYLRTILPQPFKLKALFQSTEGRGQSRLRNSTLSTTAERDGLQIDAAIIAADLWQRDYVTFEPWMDYFPSIVKLRLGNIRSFTKHMQALSVLSFRLVVLSATFLVVATTMAVFLPVTFPRWQILVLYGTLSQPLIIMFFVHWVWHRLDLSMDAIIKYFASGFFICTGMSIMYEMIMSLVTSMLFFLVTIISATGLALLGNDEDVISFEARGGYDDDGDVDEYGTGGIARLKPTIQLPAPFAFIMAVLTALVNAFLVAALVEEMSKYLSFYMVEHPDLERDNVVLLPPLNSSKITNDRENEDKEKQEVVEIDLEPKETSKLVCAGNAVSAGKYDKCELIASPIASLVSAGAAITIAMVATALGFACAENILYVFVYTPPALDAELSTLMIRCLFPIHPLAAALQSIGVVRRDLESDVSVGVGRIILPAWFLHGSFDFALMAFSLISQILSKPTQKAGKSGLGSLLLSVQPPAEEDDDETSTYVISFVLIIPVIGMVYYFQEAWEQRDRLEALDRRAGIRQS